MSDHDPCPLCAGTADLTAPFFDELKAMKAAYEADPANVTRVSGLSEEERHRALWGDGTVARAEKWLRE